MYLGWGGCDFFPHEKNSSASVAPLGATGFRGQRALYAGHHYIKFLEATAIIAATRPTQNAVVLDRAVCVEQLAHGGKSVDVIHAVKNASTYVTTDPAGLTCPRIVASDVVGTHMIVQVDEVQRIFLRLSLIHDQSLLRRVPHIFFFFQAHLKHLRVRRAKVCRKDEEHKRVTDAALPKAVRALCITAGRR